MFFFLNWKICKKVKIAVLVTLFAIICYSLIIVINENYKKDRIIDFSRYELENVAQRSVDQYKINQVLLPVDSILLGMDGHCVSFRELYSGNNKLIFYHPGNLCCQCIKSVFDDFKAVISKTDFDNIIIVSNFANIREAKLFREELEIQSDIYGIINSEMDFMLRGESLPFFYVLDSTMRICYPFIPNVNYPGVVKYYIEILKEGHIISEDQL